uniref:NADH dehydrogenase subunit 4L n=1 Tax=Scolytoplatypus wugongshanensis TaxID=2894162 RepID=UPI0023AABACB|nr:NADH dehydrogenase subunit 4L [Scolytoplatypus wugongshanensis]WCB99744.1 NADH dehydrogenase subunit 4L [Scolytoplatypus wugongshanensis]
MMNYYLYPLVNLFILSVLIFILKYKHFLIMLMSMELMVLSLYMLFFMYFYYFSYEQFFIILYLVMSVCESAMGLSLLVLIVRSHFKDLLLLLDSLW